MPDPAKPDVAAEVAGLLRWRAREELSRERSEDDEADRLELSRWLVRMAEKLEAEPPTPPAGGSP